MQSLGKSGDQFAFRRTRAQARESDGPQLSRLLRARRERPRGGSAAEQRDELAPALHSITSSARASTVAGNSRPNAFAVLRLRTRSNFVGCSTGISLGLVPRNTLSTSSAARRNRSGRLGP